MVFYACHSAHIAGMRTKKDSQFVANAGRELMEKGLLLEEDTAPESVLVAYEVVK